MGPSYQLTPGRRKGRAAVTPLHIRIAGGLFIVLAALLLAAAAAYHPSILVAWRRSAVVAAYTRSPAASDLTVDEDADTPACVRPTFDLEAATSILREATPTAYEPTVNGCDDLGPGCIAGGSLQLYGGAGAPSGGDYVPPASNVTARLRKMMYHTWWRGAGGSVPNPDAWKNTLRFDYDRALRLLPGGEVGAPPPRPFSTCSAPLIVFWDFPENFFHGMAAFTALWHAVRRGALSPNASLAIGLPFDPPSVHPFLTQPPATFMGPGVATLAQFGAASAAPGAVRCFSRLPVCTVSSYAKAPPLGMFDFLQSVKDGVLGLPPNYNAAASAAVPYALPPAERPWAAQPPDGGVVRVTLALRAVGSRRVLNVDALMRACAEGPSLPLPTPSQSVWGPSSPSLRRSVTLVCSLHAWGGGLAADVAAMQATDVLVAVHGAGLTNMGFLRPGASVIEVRPAAFKPSNADRFYRPLARDSGSVKWWGLLLYGNLTRPGGMEAAGRGNPDVWPRDRDLSLPWPALLAALQGVLPLTQAQWVRGQAIAAQTDAAPG